MRRGSSSRAAAGGGACTALQGGGGTLDHPDRRSARSLAGDGQGVLLRPDRREGARGQGPLRGAVPWLRRVHAAAQRQGRRLRVLQGLPPRRDRAALDRGAGARGDDRVAIALRKVADVLRLVHAPMRAGAGETHWRASRRRVAGGERRHTRVRYLERCARGGRTASWGDPADGVGVGVLVIWQGVDLPAETPRIRRYIRGSERR